MSLLNKIKKTISKNEDISLESADPKFWLSTGNYLINKILSGKFLRGLPQGRVTGFSGPSGSGKSFMLGNVILQAQKEGYITIILDSEHALDNAYLNAIGVDTEDEEKYLYISLSSLEAATKTFRDICASLKEEVKTNPDQKYLIVFDSLDYLITNSALETYEKKGELNNDQGLVAKKHKQFVMHVNQDIKYLPVVCVITKQVYADQEQYAVPAWKMSEAVKYAFSQLFLFTRLLDRDKTTKVFEGIRLKVFGWKNRFSKPYQQCEINVPYDTGLDPFNGLLEYAAAAGVVERNGAWYSINGQKFQSTNWDSVKQIVLDELIKHEANLTVDMVIDGVEEGHEGTAPKQKSSAQLLAERIDSKEIED